MDCIVAEEKAPPLKPKTVVGVLKSMKREYTANGFIGEFESRLETLEYRNPDVRAFVAWYNPYSGRAACEVRAYIYDVEHEHWVQFLSERYDNTHVVSVEATATKIRIRNATDEIIHEEEWNG